MALCQSNHYLGKKKSGICKECVVYIIWLICYSEIEKKQGMTLEIDNTVIITNTTRVQKS